MSISWNFQNASNAFLHATSNSLIQALSKDHNSQVTTIPAITVCLEKFCSNTARQFTEETQHIVIIVLYYWVTSIDYLRVFW